ncbi:UDP-Glycosyltransferase/glycogen phosphorylase [Meredithblackwellia eburnea MCA 4105]
MPQLTRYHIAIAIITTIVIIQQAYSSITYRSSSSSFLSPWVLPTHDFPFLISNRRLPSSRFPFQPPSNPVPVHYDREKVDYTNHPLSIHRPPSNQFVLVPHAKITRPVVGILTTTSNPGPLLRETATSLFGQSLQNFIWVIVDDHSDQHDSTTLLDDLATDPHVIILRSRRAPHGRNLGLQHLLELDAAPPYICSLEVGDMLEFTMLEKMAWMLVSNEEWSIAGSHYFNIGITANETINEGLHSGWDNFNHRNYVPGAALFRSEAVRSSGCRFDDKATQLVDDGYQDWDFWMCFAEAGLWGGTIFEPLFWHRSRSAPLSADNHQSMRERIFTRHPLLVHPTKFPFMPPKTSIELEPFTWTPAFDQMLAIHEKTIMIVLPMMAFGGADRAALNIVRMYSEQGYRVTVLCTLNQQPQGILLRPYFLQYTHDIHMIPGFLRTDDMPRYIKHLIQSRGIENVLLLSSQLFYEMLPAITQLLPYLKVIDYVHNEEEHWKAGGYPRFSILTQDFTARTVSGSDMLRQWMIDRGHTPSRIGVAKLGVPFSDFTPATPSKRRDAKKRLLNLDPETVVVTVVNRIDSRKRSIIVPLIAEEVRNLGVEKFQIVMVGGGMAFDAVMDRVVGMGLQHVVRLIGPSNKVHDYLEATDILLNPSCREGTSLSVAEAMAMEIPAVAVRAGAIPELVGDGLPNLGVTLINQTLNHEPPPELITEFDEADAKLYAQAVVDLIVDPNLRRTMGENGRRRIESTFDQKKTLTGLFEEVKLARLRKSFSPDRRIPDVSMVFALQNLLHEWKVQTDLYWGTYYMYKKFS